MERRFLVSSFSQTLVGMEFCLQPDQLAWKGASRNKMILCAIKQVLRKDHLGWGVLSLLGIKGENAARLCYILRGMQGLGCFRALASNGMALTGMLSLTANAINALTGTYVTSRATIPAIKCSAFPSK